ncbi:MAG: hypothetical protein CM15mP120_13320 [Pseudomonadota bacterium]|nr:MAG: hypothetical protein CM15mP120_13320 [Pseudomonadota bacterium]
MFGFESLFSQTHAYSSQPQVALARRKELPRIWHTFDPFIALGMAASVTQNLKLGTGISLVTERDPILMAKQVATLDHLSNGRLVLGVGAGWNAEEMENHGTPFDKRWPILRSVPWRCRKSGLRRGRVPRRICRFRQNLEYPKPKQSGGPPILMGASSRFTYDRIAEYADGWMPIYQTTPVDKPVAASIMRLASLTPGRLWEARGRDGQPSFSIFGVGPDRRAVSELVELGFDRVLFALPSDSADVVCHWWKNTPPSPTNFQLKSGMS